MTTIRSLAVGTLAASLVAAAVWLPRPAAGQTNGAPGGPAPRPESAETGADYAGVGSGQPAAPSASAPVAGYPGGNFLEYSGTAFRPQGQGQVTRLAQQYAKATKEDEKRDVKKKLNDLLGQQFDQLAVQQKKQLTDLEKQVADLKTVLEKRHDNRDSIIERRLDQLIKEAEGLGWSNPPAKSQGTPYYAPQISGTLRRQ
jgi:hypothetical protein